MARPGPAGCITLFLGTVDRFPGRAPMSEDDFAGFVRVAAAVPRVRVTDFDYNREETLALWQRADDEGCAVVYFPELGLSAYTAGDLHMDLHLQRAVLDSLA